MRYLVAWGTRAAIIEAGSKRDVYKIFLDAEFPLSKAPPRGRVTPPTRDECTIREATKDDLDLFSGEELRKKKAKQ